MLSEIVQASARAMQYPLEQKDFNLKVSISDGIPLVEVDRDAIAVDLGPLLCPVHEAAYVDHGHSLVLHRLAEDLEKALRVGSLGEPFDHMTLRVHLPEGLVLADVGFGESFHDPLPFDGAWHEQPHGPAYRVNKQRHD